MKSLTKKALDKSVEQTPRVNEAMVNATNHKVLVPLHVYHAVCQTPNFDFLTNTAMAPASSSTAPTATSATPLSTTAARSYSPSSSAASNSSSAASTFSSQKSSNYSSVNGTPKRSPRPRTYARGTSGKRSSKSANPVVPTYKEYKERLLKAKQMEQNNKT